MIGNNQTCTIFLQIQCFLAEKTRPWWRSHHKQFLGYKERLTALTYSITSDHFKRWKNSKDFILKWNLLANHFGSQNEKWELIFSIWPKDFQQQKGWLCCHWSLEEDAGRTEATCPLLCLPGSEWVAMGELRVWHCSDPNDTRVTRLPICFSHAPKSSEAGRPFGPCPASQNGSEYVSGCIYKL